MRDAKAPPWIVRMRAEFKHLPLQGEQVFISYGKQSNDSLLQYYGFVEPGIQHDTYVVPDLAAAAGRAVPSIRLPATKARLLYHLNPLLSYQSFT